MMEEHCKRFIHDHSIALVETIDIEKTLDIAYEKRLLSITSFKRTKMENSHCEKNQKLENLVSSVGSVRSLLLFCFLLSDCKEPCSELKNQFVEEFNKLASSNPGTFNLEILETAGFFTSDMTEFHNLCREIVENGDEKTFLNIVHKTIKDWEWVSDDKNIHKSEKKRHADLCLHANCLLSLFYDTDDHMHNFDKEISQVIMFTTDPFESMLLVEAAKLQSASRCVKKDVVFPEKLRKYAVEVDTNLLSKSYFLCTDVIVLLSRLGKTSDVKLRKLIIEKLRKMKRMFKEPRQRKSEELYRRNFQYRRNCMETLCRLGLAFNLGAIQNVQIEINDMDSVRNCLESMTSPDVWNTMTMKWKMLAYAAMSKWSHLNGDYTEAKSFSQEMKRLAPKIPCICKPSTLENVEKLTNTILQPEPIRFKKLKTITMPEISLETDIPVAFRKIGTDTLVVQTSASRDQSGPYLNTPFQYVLFLTGKVDQTNVDSETHGILKKHISTLHEAVWKHDIEKTKFFLQQGSDPCLENEDKITPFQISLQLEDVAIIKELAVAICNKFKQSCSKQGNSFHKVWLGYIPTTESSNVTFENMRLVAITNNTTAKQFKESFRKIPVIYRQKHEVSNESRQTLKFEDVVVNRKYPISWEEVEHLYKQHSNLNIIHPSSFRSKNFSDDKPETRQEACVALYCQIKGVIPLGENPFPPTIGGLPTDVREGYCRIVGIGDITLGTGIISQASGNLGSVGGFVASENGEVAFITAAHVVVPGKHLRCKGHLQEHLLKTNPIKICRAPEQEIIGNVIAWHFENENSSHPSIDAALVKVDGPFQAVNIIFPQNESIWKKAGYESCNLPTINANVRPDHFQIYNYTGFVMKYGVKTGLTIGRLHCPIVTAYVDYEDNPGEMCNQMTVAGLDERPFCDVGDSGAFCFMIDGNDNMQLVPFAMIIGVTETGAALITPLVDVFNSLPLDKSITLSAFQINNGQHEFHVTRDVNAVSTEIPSNHFENAMMNAIGQLSQQMAQMNSDMLEMKHDIKNIKGQLSNIPESK